MEARGEGDIIDMDWLTMFADYRVPQALVYLGALRYSDALMQALDNGETGADVHTCLSGPSKINHSETIRYNPSTCCAFVSHVYQGSC